MNWYMQAFRKYADFTGRARRSEYWFFYLINGVISTVLITIMQIVGFATLLGIYATSPNNPGGMPSGISAGGIIIMVLVGITAFVYGLAAIVPTLAVRARRLHDTGRSGWFQLLALIPVIGEIVLIIFMIEDSNPGDNQWGPNPKADLAV